MHCEEPTCALVCPADAIKKGEDGVVRSALKPRCVACNNCVLACPFGVPIVKIEAELMMKCDMCYDRTSTGLRPMCATVCPSQALSYGPRDLVESQRAATPINEFRFGNEPVRTKVFMMAPAATPVIAVDVEDYMWKAEDEAEPWIA
jgi:Fe-S-cluster-containing dehydrogenase component